MKTKGYRHDIDCGGLGDLVVGLLTAEKEAYERRIQNLVFYTTCNYRLPQINLDDLDFQMSVEGPFSERVRSCLEEIADDAGIIVKIDMSHGNPQRRFISNYDMDDIEPNLREIIHSVHLDTKELSSDQLVKKNIIENTEENPPDSSQRWVDYARKSF